MCGHKSYQYIESDEMLTNVFKSNQMLIRYCYKLCNNLETNSIMQNGVCPWNLKLIMEVMDRFEEEIFSGSKFLVHNATCFRLVKDYK